MNFYFISEAAHECVKAYLKEKGQVVELSEHPHIDLPISAHPDIQLINIKGILIVAPNADAKLLSFLKTRNLHHHLGNSVLCSPYPGHIPYNAVILEKYLLHNLKFTDGRILQTAQESELESIPVQQGYSKCSTVVVDGHAIITSDLGINKAASSMNVDCLLVQEGFVSLAPFPHGFLGGASGRVENTLVWNGSLEQHPDRNAIRAFVQSRGIENVEFDGVPLIDIGSIIEWKVD